MSYTCALSLKKIKDYLAGAAVVGFDFETSPIEEYRSEERAALDAHKAAITGVSLSVSEDSGIYIPLRHRAGRNIQRPEAVMDYLRQTVFENATVIKVAHNLAFESMFLYALGVIVQPPCYTKQKKAMIRALLGADFVITDRRYIGHEDDTGFHHYAIDVAKHYGMED